MPPKIDYISIPVSILTRKELSDKAKMLLALIAGFSPKALMLSNAHLAEVLCTSTNHVTKLLGEIRALIRIEHPQSRYRKIFYSVQNEEAALNPYQQKGTLLNPLDPVLNPNGLDTQSAAIDKIKGIKESKETKENKDYQESDSFFKCFWKEYPRKVNKPQALNAFRELNPDRALLDTMLDAIMSQKLLDHWCQDDGQCIPHPADWLIGRHWEDQLFYEIRLPHNAGVALEEAED